MPILGEAALIKAISGNPIKRDYNHLIECLRAACDLNCVNVKANSEYYDSSLLPIQNTPLSIFCSSLIFSFEFTQELITLLKELIEKGADIFHTVLRYSSLNKQIKPKHITTCFNVIICKLDQEDIFQCISPKSLQKNLPQFFEAFLSSTRILNKPEILAICLAKLEPSEAVIKDPNFLRLFFNILFANVLKPDLCASLNKALLPLLNTFSVEEKDFLLSCLNQKNMHRFILKYSEAVPWNEFLQYIKTLRPAKLEGELLWFANAGLSKRLFCLTKFHVQGHQNEETWFDLSKQVVKGSAVFQKRSRARPRLESPSAGLTPDDLLSNPEVHFHDFLGRTLLLKQGEKYFAIKFQKTLENPAELIKEYQTVEFINKESRTNDDSVSVDNSREDGEVKGSVTTSPKLHLKSRLPQAEGIGTLAKEKLDALLAQYTPQHHPKKAQFLNMILQNNVIHYYLYSAPANYFTYLHDPSLSDEMFQEASRACFHDLAELWNNFAMVYDRLGDIFHNTTSHRERTDNGRYLVLAPFIRRFYEVRESGRVDQWQNAVQYVNLRASGLADLGDFQWFEDYCQSSYFQEITQPFTNPGKRSPADSHATNLIYANLIAEYLFIFTLICGKRGYELCQQQPKVNHQAIWDTLATQLLSNAALLIHLINDIPYQQARRYLESVFDVRICARQMQFWMLNDYAKDLSQDFKNYEATLQQLYPGAEIIPSDGFRNLKPGIGFSNSPPFQDLGDYNCQNPMKEDNKLYYFVASFTVVLRNTFNRYRDAHLAFEESINNGDFLAGLQAIGALNQNRYPHSDWQGRHVDICRKRLLCLPFEVSKSIKDFDVQFPQFEIRAHYLQHGNRKTQTRYFRLITALNSIENLKTFPIKVVLQLKARYLSSKINNEQLIDELKVVSEVLASENSGLEASYLSSLQQDTIKRRKLLRYAHQGFFYDNTTLKKKLLDVQLSKLNAEFKELPEAYNEYGVLRYKRQSHIQTQMKTVISAACDARIVSEPLEQNEEKEQGQEEKFDLYGQYFNNQKQRYSTSFWISKQREVQKTYLINGYSEICKQPLSKTDYYLKILALINETQNKIIEEDANDKSLFFLLNKKGHSRLLDICIEMFIKVAQDFLKDTNVKESAKYSIIEILEAQLEKHKEILLARLPFQNTLKSQLQQKDLGALRTFLQKKIPETGCYYFRVDTPSHLLYLVDHLNCLVELTEHVPAKPSVDNNRPSK